MTAAPILLAYAALLILLGPRLMDRSRWTTAAPRLAIAVWFAMAASSVIAIVLAGLAMLVPLKLFGGHAAGLLEFCVAALSERFGETVAFTLVLGAAALVCAVMGSLAYAASTVVRSAAVERTALRASLRNLRRDPVLDVAVAEASEPAAYCIPGKGGLIVVTAGALELLDRPRLEAVLAHERAHLTGRHHMLLTLAHIGERAFGRLPLFSLLPQRVGHLVEIAADDAAVRCSSRMSLAKGLLDFAVAQAPVEALAASGGDIVARVERLLDPPAHPGRAGIGRVLGNAVLATPVLLVAAPILTAFAMACCQV